LFNDYKEVSGLKLNERKFSVIPLGTSMGMAKPPDIPCKCLFPGDHKGLLDIQVGSLYCDDAS
jgi:hypothetical protein